MFSSSSLICIAKGLLVSLLAGSVPQLQLDPRPFFGGDNFGGEFYAYGGNLVFVELFADVAEEDVGLADGAGADQEDFEHVVVVFFLFYHAHDLS